MSKSEHNYAHDHSSQSQSAHAYGNFTSVSSTWMAATFACMLVLAYAASLLTDNVAVALGTGKGPLVIGGFRDDVELHVGWGERSETDHSLIARWHRGPIAVSAPFVSMVLSGH